MGRVLRFVAILALVVVGYPRVFSPPPPFPELARGLPSAGTEREFDQRIRARFPPGISASLLAAELAREGWGPILLGNGFHYVVFERSTGLMSVEIATLRWKEDAGSVSKAEGMFRRTSRLPEL